VQHTTADPRQAIQAHPAGKRKAPARTDFDPELAGVDAAGAWAPGAPGLAHSPGFAIR